MGYASASKEPVRTPCFFGCFVWRFACGRRFFTQPVLAGTWQGGNTKEVSNAIGPVLKTFASSLFHLLFGKVESLRSWIERKVPVHAVLMAPNAQVVGHELKRPIPGIPNRNMDSIRTV
jgi:hypothetical protein